MVTLGQQHRRELQGMLKGWVWQMWRRRLRLLRQQGTAVMSRRQSQAMLGALVMCAGKSEKLDVVPHVFWGYFCWL